MTSNDEPNRLSRGKVNAVLLAGGFFVLALAVFPALAVYGIWLFARWIMSPPWGIVEWTVFIVAGGSLWIVFGVMTILCIVNGIRIIWQVVAGDDSQEG